MKHLAIALGLIAGISAVAYFVITHPTQGEAQRLERELERLGAQNDRLGRENQGLEQEIEALRDDPRLAERRARASGLARPDEVIFQFERPEEIVSVDVALVVEPDRLVLAGERVALGELAGALERLHGELAGARLRIKASPQIDPIRRQRVEDLVAASPLASAAGE